MSEDNNETPAPRSRRAAPQPESNFKAYGKNREGPGIVEVLETEQAQGFRGTVPDPTPNENYTVEGVTSGAPTPETDQQAHDELQAQTRKRFQQA